MPCGKAARADGLSRFTEVVGIARKVAWPSPESPVGGGTIISKMDG
jgi:hypothetical protein